MFPVMTSMGGMATNAPPNVCNVPAAAGAPVPTPLPSVAAIPATIPLTQAMNVLCCGCPTSVVGSTGMTTPADAAGVMLGMTGMVSGPFLAQIGASRVFSGGRPTVILTSLHGMNNCNTVGNTTLPSQLMVLASP